MNEPNDYEFKLKRCAAFNFPHKHRIRYEYRREYEVCCALP